MRRISCLLWKMIFIVGSISIFCLGCKSNSTNNNNEFVVKEDTSIFSYASERENKDSVRLKIPNHPLEKPEDLDVLMKEIGKARVVLLGEATHGTSEFYTWRAAITKRLIQEKGFDFVASESEWADSYRVNNFIKGERKDSTAVLEIGSENDGKKG